MFEKEKKAKRVYGSITEFSKDEGKEKTSGGLNLLVSSG